MMFFDALEKAIRRHIAPTVYDALRHADHMELHQPMESVKVPLQADVKVAYEKGFARFVIIGRVFRHDKKEYFSVHSAFDSAPLRISDSAAYVDYVFDKAKAEFMRHLASGAIEEMLKTKEETI